MHQFTPAEILILVAVVVGAITDMKTQKIYNIITFPATIAGIIINGMHNFDGSPWSWSGAGMSVAGVLLAYFIMCLPHPGKKLAFGDVKIMGAVGACLGPVRWLICWFYFALAFGSLSLFLIARAIPTEKWKGFWLIASGVPAAVDVTEIEAARKKKIPIGPAIAIGTILGILYDVPLMHFLGFNTYPWP